MYGTTDKLFCPLPCLYFRSGRAEAGNNAIDGGHCSTRKTENDFAGKVKVYGANVADTAKAIPLGRARYILEQTRR